MLQDRPTTTRTITIDLEDSTLDADARALFHWLRDVCSRSSEAKEQVFIFRDLSWANKLIRRDKRGEIKAIGMSDLLKIHHSQVRTLHARRIIQFRRGRWPGKWFTLILDVPQLATA